MKLVWYDKYKGLQGSMLTKARKFNRLKLVEELSENRWRVNHIEGYNKTDYNVWKEIREEYVKGNFGQYYNCECQYFSKNQKICSHILAVELFVDMHRQDGRMDNKIR